MAVLATFAAYALVRAGTPVVLALLVAVACGFVLGGLLERGVMRRFEGGDPDTAVVATIALLVLLTGISALFFGYEPHPFPSLFPNRTLDLGGVFVSLRSIGTIAVLLVVMIALQVLFRATKLGLALRAVADIFGDEVQVVVEGKYNADGTFVANTLLAKCPSKFETDGTAEA